MHYLNTVVISNKLGIFNDYNSPFENPHLRFDASILKRRVEKKKELELFAFKSVPVIIHVIIWNIESNIE